MCVKLHTSSNVFLNVFQRLPTKPPPAQLGGGAAGRIESMRRESVRRESVKHESVGRESVGREFVRQGSVRRKSRVGRSLQRLGDWGRVFRGRCYIQSRKKDCELRQPVPKLKCPPRTPSTMLNGTDFADSFQHCSGGEGWAPSLGTGGAT